MTSSSLAQARLDCRQHVNWRGAGFRVAVLEEHQVVGDPVHCTGVLAREAFDEFGLSSDAILNELTTARFISPSGQRHRSPHARGRGRGRRPRGVRCSGWPTRPFGPAPSSCGAPASRAVSCEDDGVSIHVAGQRRCRARACVLACGGRYALHRQLGLSVPSLLLHTAQRELPAGTPGDVEVHFGSDIAPRGFAWVVPVWRGGRSFRPHRRDGGSPGPDLLRAHGGSRRVAMGRGPGIDRLLPARKFCPSAASHGPTEIDSS